MAQKMIDDVYDDTVLWQMSTYERVALDWLCEKALRNRSLAVEIGTYFGGSLRTLSRHFKKVISVDIDHSRLSDVPSNVELVTGDSRTELPKVIAGLHGIDGGVGLFLIDANHEFDFVQSDLTEVLKYEPARGQGATYILIHDSWYPPSRSAILSCDVTKHPHVDLIDLDFCFGSLLDTKTTIGGFCLIRLSDVKTQARPVIKNSGELTYARLQK